MESLAFSKPPSKAGLVTGHRVTGTCEEGDGDGWTDASWAERYSLPEAMWIVNLAASLDLDHFKHTPSITP